MNNIDEEIDDTDYGYDRDRTVKGVTNVRKTNQEVMADIERFREQGLNEN